MTKNISKKKYKKRIAKNREEIMLNELEIIEKKIKKDIKKNPDVIIWSDGSCRGNPGCGGYGVILKNTLTGEIKEISGEEQSITTNNRMELMGVITGLSSLKRPCKVLLYSDSQYVVKGINIWLKNWVRKNWKNSGDKEVANKDLWIRLLVLINIYSVTAIWKSENASVEILRCDELSKIASMNANNKVLLEESLENPEEYYQTCKDIDRI
ncbi:MAG: RNase H family protein [Nanoarchaeota archaeon]